MRYIAPMDEATFDRQAHEELVTIEDALADVDPDQVEVHVSDGVLRLDLRDGTRVVINSHRAARQIWMAAISTAWHFDPGAEGKWVASKTGDELHATLRRLVLDRIGIELTL
jgi:CyaY protein